MKDTKLAGFGTLTVAIHVSIVVAHGVAHSDLGIELTTAQKLFSGVVIIAAPILAAVFLWTRLAHVGAMRGVSGL